MSLARQHPILVLIPLVLLVALNSVSSTYAAVVGFEFRGRVHQSNFNPTVRVGQTAVGRIIYNTDDLQSTEILTSNSLRYLFDAPPVEFSVEVLPTLAPGLAFSIGEVDGSNPDFGIQVTNLGIGQPDLLEMTGFNGRAFRNLDNLPALTSASLVFGGRNSLNSTDLPSSVPDFAVFDSIELLVQSISSRDGNTSHLFSANNLVFTEIDVSPPSAVPLPIPLWLFVTSLVGLLVMRGKRLVIGTI